MKSIKINDLDQNLLISKLIKSLNIYMTRSSVISRNIKIFNTQYFLIQIDNFV